MMFEYFRAGPGGSGRRNKTLQPVLQIRVAFLILLFMGKVPREQKMLKELLPRVIYHQVYLSIRR